MSSEPEIPVSKKAAKREAAKLEKLRRRQEQEEEEEEAATASMSLEEENEELSSNYGDLTRNELRSTSDPKAGNWKEAVQGKKRTDVSALEEEMAGSEVLIKGRVYTSRPQSSKVFVILRQSGGSTVQSVAKQPNVSANMIKYIKQLSCESVVEVIGDVVVPTNPVKGTSQEVSSSFLLTLCVYCKAGSEIYGTMNLGA